MKNDRGPKKPPPPLNDARLRGLALHYVGKYATTRSKLATYLTRKVRERGWDGERSADLETLVEQFAELGYVNDAQFAASRSRLFVLRGYGKRRLDENLRTSGIANADAVEANEHMSDSTFEAARNYARKKRIGPFAVQPAPPEKQHKQLQGFLRAGHSFDIAKRFVRANPGDKLVDE